jgi:hypothetical protein
MKKGLVVSVLCLAVASSLFAQKKEEGRIANSADVLRQLIAGDFLETVYRNRRIVKTQNAQRDAEAFLSLIEGTD